MTYTKYKIIETVRQYKVVAIRIGPINKKEKVILLRRWPLTKQGRKDAQQYKKEMEATQIEVSNYEPEPRTKPKFPRLPHKPTRRFESKKKYNRIKEKEEIQKELEEELERKNEKGE